MGLRRETVPAGVGVGGPGLYGVIVPGLDGCLAHLVGRLMNAQRTWETTQAEPRATSVP